MEIQKFDDGEWVCDCGLHNLKEDKDCIECHKPRKMKNLTVRDVKEELNLFGCMHDFKETSFSEFLKFNGFEIVDTEEEYCDFEYSDVKAYLDLEIKRL